MLNPQLYQRSLKWLVAVDPYAGSSCDLVPGTFTHTLRDAHVNAGKTQSQREPRLFPDIKVDSLDIDTSTCPRSIRDLILVC